MRPLMRPSERSCTSVLPIRNCASSSVRMGSSLRRKRRSRKRVALLSPLFSDDLRMLFEYMLAFVSSPKASEQVENEKQAAAQSALRYVRSGMLLGLGSGSTASYFLSFLAERVRGKDLKVNAVASSLETAARAKELGIPIYEPQRGVRVDLTIDGADEMAPDLSLVKGAGSTLLREKIVACASRHFLVIADSSKVVDQLGRRPVPLEVTPFARPWVMDKIAELGGIPVWRMGKSKPDRPCLTDQQNHIVDCDFGLIGDP